MRNCLPLIRAVIVVAGIAPAAFALQSRTPAKRPNATAPAAQATSPLPQSLAIKRLILKDGSHQGITEYEIKGDRVRYLSSERYVWEEIPTSLIDWAATEKYARDLASRNASRGAHEVDAEAEAERRKEDERTPEVAKGVRLPDAEGVYLLDVFNNQAQLNEVVQNGGEIKRNLGGNILRSTINPIASQKQTVELKGLHAATQTHVPDPYFYVNVSADAGPVSGPADEKGHFRLVRVQQVSKKNVRVVGEIKIAIYGKVKEEQKVVPINVERFSGPWLKITPAQPLEPGEYALVEILDKDQMNLFVWDFGFAPKTPANAGAWKPEPSGVAPANNTTPALSPRQKQ
jgi:hypothetical protein